MQQQGVEAAPAHLWAPSQLQQPRRAIRADVHNQLPRCTGLPAARCCSPHLANNILHFRFNSLPNPFSTIHAPPPQLNCQALIASREADPAAYAEQERRRLEQRAAQLDDQLANERKKRLHAARLARALHRLDVAASGSAGDAALLEPVNS